MPLFTTSLENQQQAASAGDYRYPQIGQVKKNSSFSDSFDRATLNPTDTTPIYTVSVNGAGGTGVITSSALLITTDAAIGDDVDVRVSELTVTRGSVLIDKRSSIEFACRFQVVDATATEGFIGLHTSNAQISAIPTTARHLGLYWDVSAGANFILTSSNGTTQVTTDTGQAVAAVNYIIRIKWLGNDSAVITFENADASSILATHTVTAIAASLLESLVIHWFCQTEALATKRVQIQEYILSSK